MDKQRLENAASPASDVETAEKRRLWPLVLWAFGLLALGFLVIGLLSARQGARLRGMPERFMEEFLENNSAAALLRAASENPDFRVTEFEDAAAIFAAYRESLPTEGELRCVRETADAERAVFAVLADGVRICRVTLRPGETSFGFGQHDWALDSVSSGELSPRLESAAVTLRCLEGTGFSLNGKAVGEAYATGRTSTAPGLSEVERRLESPPQLVEYAVAPLYGEIRVQDEAGREIAPTKTEDGYLFVVLPEERFSLEISAPRGVSVYVNGLALRPEDLADSDYGILADFRDYGTPEKIGHYRFDGLYRRPVVTARDSTGRELEAICPAEGRYVFFTDEQDAEKRETAESFLQAYLDYVALSGGRQYVTLLNRILPDTALYRYVAESAEAMVWAPKTLLETERLTAGNIRSLGEDCFACTVCYAASGESSFWEGVRSVRHEKNYELVFLRRNGVWLCAAMSEIA